MKTFPKDSDLRRQSSEDRIQRASEPYELLDSGNGEKLERFGSVVLRRPSSVCIWSQRRPKLWANADAQYQPGSGWKSRKAIDAWLCRVAGCDLRLRLQDNGQVGVFPEHASYLSEVGSSLERSESKNFRLLNLFAFTGLATTYFRARGAEVTHVDLSKKAIGWAKENFELQDSSLPPVRWICEDALAFARRELRRKSTYHAVIVDPPTFSRITKKDFWKIGEILQELVELCSGLLAEDASFMVLTCHDPGISAPMLGNLLSDRFQSGNVRARELEIPESEGSRILPAGSAALWYAS